MARYNVLRAIVLAGAPALLLSCVGRLEPCSLDGGIEARAEGHATGAEQEGRGQAAPISDVACATTGRRGPARSTIAGTNASVPRLTP